MKIKDSTVLITGSAGGIGSCTARRLASLGARVLITDFRQEPLLELAREIEMIGGDAYPVAADISHAADRKRLVEIATDIGVNSLINIAGINPFGLVADQSTADIEKTFTINTIAPIALCQSLLPLLEQSEDAHIVNVGSVFGSLGYPGFALYSASKFAVHGFTEALRRELAESTVRVHYVAPRATRTALSTDRISAMNRALGVATDEPETVAAAIEKTLRGSRREYYLGGTERMFTLINALFPGLADRVLRRQLPIVQKFARGHAPAGAAQARSGMNLRIAGVKQ